MTEQNNPHQKLLPKEHLDLPAGKQALPKPHDEISVKSIDKSKEQGNAQEGDREDHDVRTLLSWHAPGRPFKQRTKEYFINTLIIMLILVVIAFLFNQTMLILVVLSLGFLAYALATVPPHDFHYKLSTEGITVENSFFLWQELYDFYFRQQEGQTVLHVRTKALFPGALTITLGDMSQEHIKSVLLPYLPYREHVELTFTEKAGSWLGKNFPLDRLPSRT